MRIIVNITTSIIPRIIIFVIFCLILISVIAYARGYRFNMQDGSVTSTGIISINSSPQPAKVYINNQLKGATDINLTMPFGQYTIEVKKEGYTDWKKTISLKGETVMSVNAHLYPKNPSLTPLTNLGIIKALPLGNTDKIVLISQTGDITKDGIYLFEAGKRPLSIFPPLTPLLYKSLLPAEIDLSTITMVFDSQYQQAILSYTLDDIETSYLISLEDENTELIDVTPTRENITSKWQDERNTEMVKIIETLHKDIRSIALTSFTVISLSPDEKKLMYYVKDDVSLPIIINPPLIGANQTLEQRDLKKGNVYIYDKKEDKNYRVQITVDPKIINEALITPTVQPESTSVTTTGISNPIVAESIQQRVLWYPTSDYIAIKEKSQIVLMQYDGDNKQTVYAGPFNQEFFAISPDWNLIVIINLNPNNNQFGDLYSVGIK